MKYIVVTGGVISGLGKGITASSIGLLLKGCGVDVTAIKIDPYLNIDAGTMSPYEHGECYVLGDGGEVDLDIGNYERFLAINLTSDHNITTGKIYDSVIKKERAGKYLGKTVQIVPHITNVIKEWIIARSKNTNHQVCIIEVGGTVGDIETMPFIEALRQMSISQEDTFCFVHVAPVIDYGEYKTKPIQNSLEKLRSFGIMPNMLVIRTPTELSQKIIEKLELFSNIPREFIIQNTNVKNIYYVPELFNKQNIVQKLGAKLNLGYKKFESSDYYKIIDYFDSCNFDSCNRTVSLGIVGKYLNTPDTYLSILRAVECAGIDLNIKIDVHWINPDIIDNDSDNQQQYIQQYIQKYDMDELKKYNGIIIPGGFGSRGIAGKLRVIEFARLNNIPILGICLGMQLMVIDCFNSISADRRGISTEWENTDHDPLNTICPVIDILPNQTGQMGGTMRLGNFETRLVKPSKVYDLYGQDTITERHRHRYEVNNNYLDDIEKSGLRFVGFSVTEKSRLMEIVELDNHPFYVGCQYHPEFNSKYNKPNPLFIGLVSSMLKV